MTIAFTKVKLPYGWLGNMSPYPVFYDGKWWKTTEHLFQALRFKDGAIQGKIRREPNPFQAKLIAKRHKDQMTVVPRSRRDVVNLRLVLRLKLKHHPELRQQLLETGNQTFIEDASSRPHGSGKFWARPGRTASGLGRTCWERPG